MKPAHNVVVVEAVRLLSDMQSNGQAQPYLNEPAELMHPARCTTSSQCPMSVCKNGLCRNTAIPMSTADVLASCFADLPWPADCTSVPQDCRQP